jgi:ribosomal-protein-alanine N-acetyltransferase
MALLKTIARGDLPLTIEGDGVTLRFPQPADYQSWSQLREESRAFLTPWEPTWPRDDLTKPAYRRRLRHYARELKDDQAYPFFLFRNVDDALIGGLTLSGVRRGVTQSCSIGYWVGQRFSGAGCMSAAVRSIIPFVFDELRLHRLEAACLPSNEPSKRLLAKVGFTEEGYARRYLRINGAWRDHVLFGLVADDPRS